MERSRRGPTHARENLKSYWQGQYAAHRVRSETPGSGPLTDDMMVWLVLGVGRLHALIASGLLLSKGQAADYERATFPAHNAIIAAATALRLAQRPAATFEDPGARYRAVLDFLHAVIADGLACPA